MQPSHLESLISACPELKSCEEPLSASVDLIASVFEKGGTLFLCGNGGSMSDALHISGELLKGFRIERRSYRKSSLGLQSGVPVWVLGNNPSLYSAAGNDLAAPSLEFAQELFAAAREGDVLLGISTSGRAKNVCNAFTAASEIGVRRISLTGMPGEPLAGMADVAIKAPGRDTAAVQEYHQKIYHALCSALEERLFGETGSMTGPYGSRYARFDFSPIVTYSISERENRTDLERLVHPPAVKPAASSDSAVRRIARACVESRRAKRPVILMTGAHFIKNGLGPLVIDLLDRGILTHVAGNGACPIHDVELALCGGTSERVPEALPRGRFGFARETAAIVNGAYREAWRRRLGAGEAVGAVLAGELRLEEEWEFPYREHSVFYNAYRLGIPATVHGTIGTDIVDQHPGASFSAKGAACGTDFAILAQAACRMTDGGVVIDVGGAVTQPEVLLKAVSMAANTGKPPKGIVTAVFDFLPADPRDVRDENKPGYYRRDLKSVVVRIPEAFGGEGHYVQGDQRRTLPDLYAHIRYLLKKGEP